MPDGFCSAILRGGYPMLYEQGGQMSPNFLSLLQNVLRGIPRIAAPLLLLPPPARNASTSFARSSSSSWSTNPFALVFGVRVRGPARKADDSSFCNGRATG